MYGRYVRGGIYGNCMGMNDNSTMTIWQWVLRIQRKKGAQPKKKTRAAKKCWNFLGICGYLEMVWGFRGGVV